ncbi:nuclear pore complex protein Nup214-like isoform X1 [Melanaphis sacchari]|uniref:nuclear pore complex protein Nup214-like isoform X1 n=1 Tax=Melanaphis sacchari TaxID=742174 RepID=UPI000DC15262|nr:nuclear pore complex protein Nup214-like isoform X1 [Melanaphis sacchari]
MSTHVKGSCVDVLDFKCPAFCNLRIFKEGHQFDKYAAMIINSNRFGITFIASPNQLCLISMKHVRQLVGDFGVEKNTLTDFLRREIELDYSPNFLDLSCDEEYIAVAGILNSKTSIVIYSVEDLISKDYPSPLVVVELAATQESHVIDMSWNPGVKNSLACCLSDGSLHIIDLKDGGTYSVVSLPPQSSTLCLSWSPKGKQIIIGSSNGSLTQYKPELKAMKQYLPPTDVTGNVKPIKIKWISNFQFAVVYDFVDNIDNQQNLYILNTPKNAPVEFINFEQYVVMNSEQYRLNQYYTIFQQNWNLLFVGSSNCTEIGIMGINNENHWQCWMLETRPELPYRLDKQMYPIGMSLDLSSQMQIKQLSKSNEEIFLDPMPVLCVLSSDGILFMYHIENQLADSKNICKPPTEISDKIISRLFTTSSKINNLVIEPTSVTEIVEQGEEINVVDEKARGDHNESVLASYLETSTTSEVEQPQILDTPTISVVKPNIPEVSTETVTPVQNISSQTNLPDNNTSTDETVSQEMLKEVLEDVQIFQLQLEDILKLSLNTSTLKIGDEKDKEILMKKWTSLDSFFKELNETNRSQWVECKSLQKAVLDSIAWVEDSKSRLFFLKNPKFKCLLRNDSDEPFSKTLFDNIERTLYYIETQLTHVDDQLKARYDSYNPNNKELKIPCLETIYKSLVVNTNIVNKLKEKINYLYSTVEEMKYRTFKKLSLAPDVVQNTSKLHESRDVGLSKLSEQLLKITLDKDGVSAINSYNVAKKYSVLSANQRALSDSKVNKLQEWLKDFKTRRTKITRSQYANIDLSRPMCSTPLKSASKSKIHEKNIDFTPFVTKDNFVPTLPQPSTLLNKNYNISERNATDINLQPTSQHDLTQFQKPLLIPPTTQQKNPVTPIVAPCTPGFTLGSKPVLTNTVWNPMDNSSTPKPLAPNDYKGFTKDPIVFSTANTVPLFANNVTCTTVSSKNPVDFSLKTLTATPLNFSNSSNIVSTKSTLDVISGTTETKEKILSFNFSNVSTAKSEKTVQKSNGTSTFNFADSIKNKMDNLNNVPISTLSFEAPKTSETSSIFSGFNAENKSKNNQEKPSEKEATTFKFNSKPDTVSFSSFSFTTPKENISKSSESETKSFISVPTTSVTASFNFSLPPKTNPIVSEPVDSPTVSSSFGTVKTALDFSTVSATVESNVTESTPQVSESPTPIISEPITPEKEESPKFPVTASSAQIFEIPSTNVSIFGASIKSTSTTSIFGNSTTTTTTSQATIFSTPTNKTSAPSIFSTPTTTSAPSIFSTPTNTTCAPSIFSTPTSTTVSSIFGATTSTTNVSSIFGSPTNTSIAPSIFGASSTTASSSIFGNSIKSTSSIFGSPSTTTVSSMFGSITTTNTTSVFGSTAQTTTFGAPTTSSSIFGNPAAPATTSSSIFGNPTAPATTSSSIFGNPTAPATTSSSIFGNPTAPSTTSSSIFGNPAAPTSSGSIFGSPSSNTSSVFGAPVTTSTSSIFGSPSTTAASSGLFGSVAAAANQSSFGQPTLGFSSPGSAFGNMSLFGQSACSPSQPANSFAPAANPFAVNKTASSTPSLFSSQKSVFGQPPASTPNTGFGVQNSGFGATASTGFGSPAIVGQSNNLGFGSPPMFGSMGTTSSGFNQTPVFGGAATFGSTAPTFGQNAGNFGFGSAAQQPSTAFASLATQNTSPSFGNIAQNQNTGFASPTTPGFGQPQQTSPFKPQGTTFGGTSFSSWR